MKCLGFNRGPLRWLVLALFAWLALRPAASAHRLDEYLQATLVIIEPGEVRLQMDLTPGVAVADSVLATIDRDHDGAISADEAQAYAAAVSRDLTAALDAHPLPLKVVASRFPEPAELREGSGIIQIELAAASGAFIPGAHRLTIENRHQPAISVYLLNAGQPAFFAPPKTQSGTIEIDAQKRVENQALGTIEFTFHPVAAAAASTSRPTPRASFLALLIGVVILGVWGVIRSEALRRSETPPQVPAPPNP